MNKKKSNQRIGKITSKLDGVFIGKFQNYLVLKKIYFGFYMYWTMVSSIHKNKFVRVVLSKTTINTLIKECESDGYITLETIPGKKRELQICLTEKGLIFAQRGIKACI